MAGLSRKRRRETVYLGTRRTFASLRQNGWNQSVLVDSKFPVNSVQNQVTDSEGHPWPIHLKPGELKRWDVGGDFKTTRTYLSDPDGKPITWVSQYGWIVRNGGLGSSLGNYEIYNGPILPVDITNGGYFPLSVESTSSALDAIGATAIALCKPTNPVSNVLVAAGEMYRDGLPSLLGAESWRARTLRAKQAGGEYLNVQFGWKPLVRDIMQFVDATQNTDKLLAQYERDAGKIVRRRFHFPMSVTDEESLISSSAAPFGPNGSALVTTTGRLVRHRTTRKHQWFSGAFTYYLPRGNDYRAKMVRVALEARKLYGLSLTPEVLWEVAPWSWALDWFSNFGDVLSNVSDFATMGLIMRYGYIMETTTVIDTYVNSGWSRRVSGESPPKEQTSLSLTTQVKQRRRATPFGFGVSWEGLSPFQLSILAALGMSQGRR